MTASTASSEPPSPAGLLRLPVDKPQLAVEYLHEAGRGVMDLIAHFWEQLPQTPPLTRNDLHLMIAYDAKNAISSINTDISSLTIKHMTGAMLYVPKAHRADVLAQDEETARQFAAYITQNGVTTHTDGTNIAAIDFISGSAFGVLAMIPHLLPHVKKRTPARQMVNAVMHLPESATPAVDPSVRLARESDIPMLSRWRRHYKEERGILFDADLVAMVNQQRAFVYEAEGHVVAAAKFDIEINRIIEIGGVYTFPEFRNRGYGRRIVDDIAIRIRQRGKVPVLQVDRENIPACRLYERAGWQRMGELARVWLTAS